MNSGLSEKQTLIIGTIAGLTTNTIFGFSFMFSRIIMMHTEPENMLMLRFLLAFAMINLVVLILKCRPTRPEWLEFDLRGKPLLPLFKLGMLQPVAYFICESYGIDLTNATMSGVMIALIPIIGIVIGVTYLGEKTNLRQCVFAVLSVIGVALLAMEEHSEGAIHLLGILFLCGAIFTGAFTSALSRKVSDRYTPLERTYVMMAMGAIFFTCYAIARGHADFSAALNPSVLLPMLYLSVLSSIVAFLMLNVANNCLPLAKVASFANVTTVLSTFAGVLFLGEPFGFIHMAACAVILVGIIGVQKTG